MRQESPQQGFVVAREDAVPFLEEKLALLGLSDRESADFITYWAPRIRAYEYTFVSFDASAYTQRASYSFTDEAGATVTPDTFIRVFMTIREADANTVVQPQTLARHRRAAASRSSNGAARSNKSLIADRSGERKSDPRDTMES